MRVAAINTHPIQHFAPLWREISKANDIELKVFYCCDWGVTEYADPGFASIIKWDVDLLEGYRSEFLPIRRRPRRLGFWETDNPSIGRALSKFCPEVLVLFGYGHLTTWRALLWAKRHGARVLIFADSELKHRRNVARRLVKEALVRGFLSTVDGVLTIGNCNTEYYLHYGVQPPMLHPCAYPVDGSRFRVSADRALEMRAALRRKHGIGNDVFVFLSIGKLISRKRHQDVIRAWMALSREKQERSHVLLVGDGPLRPELEHISKDAVRVTFAGFVNQTELPAYYVSSDALVVASEIDAHPLVVTESLFAGLPIVASDAIGCIGPDDTLREGENGLVYRCGEVAALTAAMNQLMSAPRLCEDFAIRSRELSADQDAPGAAKKFMEAFRRVVQSRPRGFTSLLGSSGPFTARRSS